MLSYNESGNQLQTVDVGPYHVYNMYNLKVFGNKLYLVSDAKLSTKGSEVHIMDISNTFSTPYNLNITLNQGCNCSSFYESQNRLYFSADDGTTGQQLYFYDKNHISYYITPFTTGGTNANPQNFISYKNEFYFSAITDSSIDMYKLDTLGTAVSLSLLKTIRKGTDFSDYWVSAPFKYNGLLFFFASDTSILNGGLYQPDMQLWQTDGTTLGTKKVVLSNNIPKRYAFNSTYNTVQFNGSVYFKGNIDATTDELNKFTSIPLAVSPLIENNNILVYPNPFENFIKINSDKNLVQKAIITNMHGSVILHQDCTSRELLINTQHLTNGLYMLQLFDTKNEVLGVYKIWKK